MKCRLLLNFKIPARFATPRGSGPLPQRALHSKMSSCTNISKFPARFVAPRGSGALPQRALHDPAAKVENCPGVQGRFSSHCRINYWHVANETSLY
jgi:hypothetical protein